MFRRTEEPKTQGGGSLGDEYITYEIESNKAQRLAEWLNHMDANGYELSAHEGYGSGSSAHIIAVARCKRR